MSGPWSAERWEREHDAAWRGDLHPDEDAEPWPEEDAGPEYRMWRDLLDDDDGDDA